MKDIDIEDVFFHFCFWMAFLFPLILVSYDLLA